MDAKFTAYIRFYYKPYSIFSFDLSLIKNCTGLCNLPETIKLSHADKSLKKAFSLMTPYFIFIYSSKEKSDLLFLKFVLSIVTKGLKWIGTKFLYKKFIKLEPNK